MLRSNAAVSFQQNATQLNAFIAQKAYGITAVCIRLVGGYRGWCLYCDQRETYGACKTKDLYSIVLLVYSCEYNEDAAFNVGSQRLSIETAVSSYNCLRYTYNR